jgi:hypothetical protein
MGLGSSGTLIHPWQATGRRIYVHILPFDFFNELLKDRKWVAALMRMGHTVSDL